MVHIKTFDSFINEMILSEGLIPPKDAYKFSDYDENWSEDDDSLISVDYNITTPKAIYKVTFYSGEYSAEDKTFDLTFGVDKGDFNRIDPFEMTDAGNVRTFIKTIAAIIEDFLYQYDYAAEKVIIDGTDDKRKKLYKTLFPMYLSKDTLKKVVIK